MNERIRQLARQSTGASTIYMLEEEWTKFAELIVRECVEVVKWTPSMFPNDTVIKNIKEHFGVEL
jgi:hypothetical protein